MTRTTLLSAPAENGAATQDHPVTGTAPIEGLSLVGPVWTDLPAEEPEDGGADAGADDEDGTSVVLVGLGIPVVRSFMTAEELEAAAWQDRALCSQTDPEAFFPEKGGSTREAKRVCLGCEVRTECLEYALTHDERFGIWGGLSERERRRVKRAAV